MLIKVRVGQIWSHTALSQSYRITATTYNQALAIASGTNERECYFGPLNSDGTPRNWSSSWTCQTLTDEEQAAIDDQKRRLKHAMQYL